MRGLSVFHIAKLYEFSIPWYNTHMQKAYRYRLYPTDEQTQMMTRIIGCC
ncbi:MAG TPA: helix-turn-helix domain-containing protein, partial [Candidatus Ornithospirochaeta stercorigallinarum]|nr:helix-turn-helix domain-containing protein [Candidatus Ornithospirochaeta stercorigallinarum]